MSAETTATAPAAPPPHEPFVPPFKSPHEFTLPAILAGTVLGIIFGASSLYLFLKVGMTVSASVPVAVLSITLFRVISRMFRVRNTTILENNIVQTAGSAGESIAFGVGATMPALLLLGFEMDVLRVMTVSILGAILGILMMIPLRRAFIVKQHGSLTYPEGVACAEVLVAGEKGGATAKMVFVGFGIAAVYKFLDIACKLWSEVPSIGLTWKSAATGQTTGLKGAEVSGELSPELLGVGYILGARIACLMMGGALLSYFVMGPVIATFGDQLEEAVPPAKRQVPPVSDAALGVGGGMLEGIETVRDDIDPGLIRNMDADALRKNYLLIIGAGAVAAAGIIGMGRALPLIVSSLVSGLRDLRATRAAASAGMGSALPRTERDMPMSVVVLGSLALVVALAAVPSLGLGLNLSGFIGAVLILLFGFLFVTVSSRLTGEVGSSSNPISGMTIATLLLVCVIFLILGMTGVDAMLTALTIAAVVCIASSNGGTTSQDLKTGFLVGATPYKQQWAILIGAVTSAVVIGVTLLALNDARVHYTKKGFPHDVVVNVPSDAPKERPGRPYDMDSDGIKKDDTEYRIVHVRDDEYEGLPAGRYLVNASGNPVYRTDEPINRVRKEMDNDVEAAKEYAAPQPALFANIIKGILRGKLQWSLFIIGALIAIALEFCGVSALPVAVGMYIPFSSTTPIFVGGMIRYVAEKFRGKPRSEAETETSPGVLLASGFIAGGTLCGLIVTFFDLLPDPEPLKNFLNLGGHWFGTVNDKGKLVWKPDEDADAKIAAAIVFGLMGAFLMYWGSRKQQQPV